MHTSFEQFPLPFAGETNKTIQFRNSWHWLFAIITGTAILNMLAFSGVSSGALAETKADSFLSYFDKRETRRSREEITHL